MQNIRLITVFLIVLAIFSTIPFIAIESGLRWVPAALGVAVALVLYWLSHRGGSGGAGLVLA